MSSRGQISARQRNATYRPNGKLTQHVLDATIVDATITEPVRLGRALAPMLVGRAVIETGRQFYLVASKFEHRFYVAVYRNGVTILFGAKHTLRDRSACSARSVWRQRRGKLLSHLKGMPLSPLLLDKRWEKYTLSNQISPVSEPSSP